MKTKSRQHAASINRKRCVIYTLVILAFVGYVLFLYRMVLFQHEQHAENNQGNQQTVIDGKLNLRTQPTHVTPLQALDHDNNQQKQTNPSIHVETTDHQQSQPVEQKSHKTNQHEPVEKHPEYPKQPPPILLTTASSLEELEPAVVIVGGTDGSGTRRVVQVLTELGVKMVSEDPETYDIHADLVGGWPPIVSPVIRHTHSLNYHPQLLTNRFPHHSAEIHSLQRLLQQVEIDSHKPTSHVLAQGGVLPRASNAEGKNTLYGFKAPVSMTLLPYWHSLLPNLIFLHVLRDGRDIAFSVNQGPVEKFYQDMYANNPETRLLHPPQKAIKLWSDWNSQLYHYAKEYVNAFSSSAKGDGAGEGAAGGEEKYPNHRLTYQVVHSEDLVDDSRMVRFAAMYALAKLVRSTMSVEEICCLSVKDVSFMGSHDRSVLKNHGGNGQEQLSSRYGKWKKQVAGNEALNRDLHSLGKEGLKVFGYDPMRPLAEDLSVPYDDTSGSYTCTMTHEQCLVQYSERMKDLEDASHEAKLHSVEWGISGTCDIHFGVDYKGEDLDAVSISFEHPTECCM
jgi:hypothetical protein